MQDIVECIRITHMQYGLYLCEYQYIFCKVCKLTKYQSQFWKLIPLKILVHFITLYITIPNLKSIIAAVNYVAM